MGEHNITINLTEKEEDFITIMEDYPMYFEEILERSNLSNEELSFILDSLVAKGLMIEVN